jgi:hypothetical protein
MNTALYAAIKVQHETSKVNCRPCGRVFDEYRRRGPVDIYISCRSACWCGLDGLYTTVPNGMSIGIKQQLALGGRPLISADNLIIYIRHLEL